MGWWNEFLNVLGIGAKALEARSHVKIAKIEARADAIRQRTQLEARRVASEADWEATAAQNSANSWLDEWWTVVLSLPLIAAFVPWAVPYVHAGFEALEPVPDWYVWAVLASVSFAFARKNLPGVGAWRRKGRSPSE